MTQTYEIWKSPELADTFLEGVRGAVPLATEQIEIVLRILRRVRPQVDRFLDLGCGNGILGQAILRAYPLSRGVFLDLSETMLKAAGNKLELERDRIQFIHRDFGISDWIDAFPEPKPFDAIVSGFAIHHQPDNRKREIYREIYQLLKPGGIFINLEHIESHTKLGEELFDELFVDSLYAYHQSRGNEQSREELARQYYNRDDKSANILAPVELQCQWLREIGFEDVDCFFKIFEIAIFGGIKN